MTWYVSVAGTDGPACGCSCTRQKLGDTLIVDFSGIQICPCVEDPDHSVAEARAVVMPSEWEVNAVSDTEWRSDAGGSFEVWTGAECDNLTLAISGYFQAFVTCLNSPGESFGRLAIELRAIPLIGNDVGAFGGQAAGIGDAAENGAVCQNVINPPLQLDLFFGGTATVSQP